jgi:hypothetical protein
MLRFEFKEALFRKNGATIERVHKNEKSDHVLNFFVEFTAILIRRI